MDEIELGDKVDYLLVPGYTGVVTAMTQELSGIARIQCNHFLDSAGNVHDGLLADANLFSLIERCVLPPIDCIDHSEVPLGSLVRCLLTGYRGTVTRKIIWLSGCVTAGVAGEHHKKNEELAYREIPLQFLSVLRADHFEQLTKPSKRTETGGPPMKIRIRP